MGVRTGILAFVVVLLTLTACGPREEVQPADGWISPLPHGAKGYELYSWRPAGQRQWNYVLVTGTNRLKTLEEVTSLEDLTDEAGWVRISVQGLDELEALLRRLPQGENVTWIDTTELAGNETGTRQIGMPEGEVIQQVRDRCQRLGIKLSITARPLSER